MAAKYTVEAYEDKILDFLDMVLDEADFDLDADVDSGEGVHPEFESPDLMVRFTGEDVDLLLANKGELLLALEHLTQEALRIPQEDHNRICFDANDYRLMRIQELRMTAETAAERVKKTGQPFFFSPMTSRERRILHIALRNETELRSESVGIGPQRQVCLLPKDAPLPPAPPPPRRFGGGDRDGGGRGRDGDRRGGGRGGFNRDRRGGPPRGDRGPRGPRGPR